MLGGIVLADADDAILVEGYFLLVELINLFVCCGVGSGDIAVVAVECGIENTGYVLAEFANFFEGLGLVLLA